MSSAIVAILLLLVIVNGEPQRQQYFIQRRPQQQQHFASASNYYNPLMNPNYWSGFKYQQQQKPNQAEYYPSVYPSAATNLNDLIYRGSPSPFIQNSGGRAALFSFTVATHTTTVLTTAMTTCTTSTAALNSCTGAAARRSRGSFHDDSQKNERALRGLLHDEETEDEQEEGSIFLPVPVSDVKQTEESGRSERQMNLEYQALASPFGVEPSRFNTANSLLSANGLEHNIFGNVGSRFRAYASFVVFTTTAYSTTTSTVSLTAVCASTTGYNLCAASG